MQTAVPPQRAAEEQLQAILPSHGTATPSLRPMHPVQAAPLAPKTPALAPTTVKQASANARSCGVQSMLRAWLRAPL